MAPRTRAVPVASANASSSVIPSSLTDSATLSAQADLTPTDDMVSIHDTPPDPSGQHAPAAQMELLLSDRERELVEEERRLDEELAIARREQQIRQKRAELERLRSALVPPAGVPPVVTAPVAPQDAPPVADPPVIPHPNTPLLARPALAAQAQLGSYAPVAGPTWRTPSLKHPKYEGGSFSSLLNFLYDCEANFHLMGAPQSSADRVAYAVSCLSGSPKNAWVKYVREHGMAPGADVTWVEFTDFLQKHHSDPNTRALSAISQLDRLQQGTSETVSDFIDRFTTILVDLPYPTPEIQRINMLVPKFRPEVSLALQLRGRLPDTFDQLVSDARGVEDTQRHAGTSAYRESDAKTSTAPSSRAPDTSRPRTCFGCGQSGHIQRDCPNTASTSTPTVPAGGARPMRGSCYTCGEQGHYSNTCPRSICNLCKKAGHTANYCPDGPSNANREPLGNRRGANAAS